MAREIDGRTSLPARLARGAMRIAVGGLALVIGAWLVGRIASDRWTWSQWLLWIPTPAAIVATVLGLAAAALNRRGTATVRRRRIALWATATAGLLVYFGAVEHHLSRRPDSDADGVRLVHWTMSHRKQGRGEAGPVLDRNGDITILVDAWGVFHDSALADRFDAEHLTRLGRMFVITRRPVLEMRHLVAAEGAAVTLAVIDTTNDIGRPLVLYIVDFPSSPGRSRMALARTTRRWLDGLDAPAPDVVVGDFNMTRGSASLSTLFPGLRHAYDTAGAGYAATFHRALPLYHIDHVLTGAGVRATAYRVVDPGIGRHRIQVVQLVAD